MKLHMQLHVFRQIVVKREELQIGVVKGSTI